MSRDRRSVSVDAVILEDAERKIRVETGKHIPSEQVVDRALRLREQLENADEIVPESEAESIIEHALLIYAELENPEDLLGDTNKLTSTGSGSRQR